MNGLVRQIETEGILSTALRNQTVPKEDPGARIPLYKAVQLRAADLKSDLEGMVDHGERHKVAELKSVIDPTLREVKDIDSDTAIRHDR